MPTLSNISKGETNDMPYNAILNKNAVIAKLNPGASHAFISRAAAKQCTLKRLPVENVETELGDNYFISPFNRGSELKPSIDETQERCPSCSS